VLAETLGILCVVSTDGNMKSAFFYVTNHSIISRLAYSAGKVAMTCNDLPFE